MFARFFGGSTPDAADGASPKEEEGGSNANASGETPPQKDPAVASHISKMDSIIRRKLHGTGAQYNMKVVIRGERGVGKSTLWRRLQGLPYEEKYTPTPEIQTTTINNWVYRGSQDVVKVEVWDVVDKGLARGGVGRVHEGEDLEDAVAGLPPDSSGAAGGGGRSLAILDAGVVNVYQGASAIIFMVDPYRPETLDKVEKGLAEAPVNLPTVVLLNFRDKLEEDAVARASETPGRNRTPSSAGAPAAGAAGSPPVDDGYGEEPSAAGAKRDVSAAGAGAGADGGPDHPGTEQAAGGRVDGARSAKGGAWDHVVTLETARLMMERVREADEAAGRGSGRRVSLFDCSMKNCFGLRVLYTYLNVPFLELKRQSLLQQATIAAERLEREYQELAGFIGGHSYGNYMQHLRTSDVDPTAGRSAPAAPPGRPSIASMPPTGEGSSLERRGSVDSGGGGGGGGGGKKDKKKKKDKDRDRDKSKKKDKHRHKSGKSRKDEREDAAPEYGGRVTDAKDFAPVAKKAATDELADFFGESSDGDSGDGLQERRKVVKAINRSALASVNAARDDATDSDEMPAPRTSRLKRVTAPTKPVVSAAASVEKPSSSAIRSQKPASGVPRSGTAAGAGGTEPAAREERPTPQAALTAAKVAERNEVEEEEEDKKPLAVRESGGGAAEEVHEQEAGVPPTEGEGSMGKGEEQAAAGADAITVAEEVNDTAAGSGGDGGADGGELPETVVAAASSSATRAPSQAGKEAETMHEGRDSEEDGSRAGAKDPHAADRKSGGEHNQAEAEGSASGEDRTGGEEDVQLAIASSSPVRLSPPAAQQQHLPSEPRDRRQHPEAAPPDEPREVDAGTEALSDNGVGDGAGEPAEACSDDGGAPPGGDLAPGAGADPIRASAEIGIEEEGVGAADVTADELAGAEGVVGVRGQVEEEGGAGIEENAPTAAGSEQAGVDNVDVAAPASSEAELVVEHGELGEGAKEEPDGGGDVGSESGDGRAGSGAAGEADAEFDGEEAVDAEVDPANAIGEAASGGGVEKPNEAATALEPETISGNVVGEGEAVSGGLAEDFFAGDNSSGDDELYPGAAAAAGDAAGALATRSVGSDRDPDSAVSEQPPSPRIIASSAQGGFQSPVVTQGNETASAAREKGLSEAAKAAVAAALANAASATSRRGDDGSKSRKKKKKSHKERRRKRSGSKSAGEEDSGAGSRDRSEADGDGRTKRSSSRRHHRRVL